MRLEIHDVHKEYRGGVHALSGVTLLLEPGVFGLLGPNGAGKSTLMRILATLAKPSRGHVTWNGVDLARSPDAMRRVLGYLPQDFGVYPHLTPQEFLEYLAAARGLSGAAARQRIDTLLEIVNLGDARRRPLGGFSGGMRQRVGIAQALLGDPQVLIVDEPTGGLDPEERVRFRNLLADLAGNRIVILSTHIVSDVEAVAGRIGLLAHGRLLADESPEALLRSAEGSVWELRVPSGELAAVRARHRVAGLVRGTDGATVRIVAAVPPRDDARAVAPTLEDAYLLRMDLARTGAVPAPHVDPAAAR